MRCYCILAIAYSTKHGLHTGGVNKAGGISIKMTVKGKLRLNINLGQECIY